MIAFLSGGRCGRRQVKSDADTLEADVGNAAYDLARWRANDALEAHNHWTAVRREIGRRTGRSFLDTATRMLKRSRT